VEGCPSQESYGKKAYGKNNENFSARCDIITKHFSALAFIERRG
jgi:hypothetical protein